VNSIIPGSTPPPMWLIALTVDRRQCGDGFPGIVVVGEDRNTIDTVRWTFCKRFFVVLAQIGTIHYHFLIGGASRANYESTHVFFEIGPNDNIAHLVVVVCPHIL